MSLNRLLLRQAAVHAASNMFSAPFPTLAGHMVFDSKVEPVENFEADMIYPTIVIYTDYDRNHISHQDLGYTTRTMTITFELLMAVINHDSELDDPDSYIMRTPTTDSELEASLDIMESQLFASLHGDSVPANVFKSLAYGMENIVSRRGATVEGGTKIAARQVTYEARVLQEMANPIMPAFAAPFIELLEAQSGSEKVAAQLRQLYLANNNVEGLKRLQATLAWSDEAFAKLGYSLPGAPTVQVRPIVWLNPNGTPFLQ